jgi:hypothetical protein
MEWKLFFRSTADSFIFSFKDYKKYLNRARLEELSLQKMLYFVTITMVQFLVQVVRVVVVIYCTVVFK